MKNKTINIIIIVLINILFITKIYNQKCFNKYNDLLWLTAILLLTITSIYFMVKLKFKQFNIINIIKSLRGSNFNSLFVSLGAKIGVGCISGIAIAIYLAGPGVILWLWISSIIFSIMTYCESYLGVVYKKGAFNYIQNGLNNKLLSLIYTIILILSYVIGFIGIQSNTIVKSIHYTSNINKISIVLILIVIVSIILFKSLDKILNFISKLVPLMCILYILLGGIIMFINIDKIPSIINNIIIDALTIKTSIKSIIIIGIQRSIFATESGIGTTSIAGAISKNNPSKEAMFQVFGVYFTSLIICTITAIIVLTNDYGIFIKNINGIEIVMNIFYKYLGPLGSISLILIIFLFAISTIISGYYYGVSALEFIDKKRNNTHILLFKTIIIIIIFIGGIINSSIIWSIVDTFILYLLLINTYAIIKLRHKIK